MASPDLSDYIEVPDRIAAFKSEYPDGSLQGEHEIVTIDGKVFVQYIAYAYRTPDDPRPGKGTTWEPYPGTTPFTTNSEIENAETSAWGRALVAIGFVGKKVASANEVRNRVAEQGQDAPRARMTPGKPSGKPSEAQKIRIKQLVTQKKATPAQLKKILVELGADAIEVEPGWMDRLTAGKEGTASALITYLKERPLPDLENPSDVPNDGFEPPAGQETLDDVLAEEAA